MTPQGWFVPLRAELPVLEECIYLNTGTTGPIPRAASAAMMAEVEHELLHGRGNFATWDRFFALIERSRLLAATAMGATPAEVALTHHTSDGINIALWGHEWSEGDEVLTTTLEHDAICVPLGLLARRRGVTLRFVDIGLGDDPLPAICKELSPKTKLVALSHIAYNSGALLPIKAITAAAHAVGARVLVDGAQTCGAMPLDVHDLDVDFYTLSGQKWLLGPEGTGALYVKHSVIEKLEPTFGSYFSPQKHDFRGHIELHPSARRFETGMVHRPSWAAFEVSTRWLLETVGVERAWARSLQLVEQARAGLETIDGVEVISPASCPTPLLSFDLPHFSPRQLFALALQLARREQLVIRSTPHQPFCLRATFAFFNTEAEVDQFCALIAQAAQTNPEQLPAEGYALKLPEHR